MFFSKKKNKIWTNFDTLCYKRELNLNSNNINDGALGLQHFYCARIVILERKMLVDLSIDIFFEPALFLRYFRKIPTNFLE